MLVTTLKRLEEQHIGQMNTIPQLLYSLKKNEPDHEPLPFATIVNICGMHDALECCRAEPKYAVQWRSFAVWCARRIPHQFVNLIDVAERHANGTEIDDGLEAAHDAAWVYRAVTRPTAWEAIQETAAAAATSIARAAARAATGDRREIYRIAILAEEQAQRVKFLEIVK